MHGSKPVQCLLSCLQRPLLQYTGDTKSHGGKRASLFHRETWLRDGNRFSLVIYLIFTGLFATVTSDVVYLAFTRMSYE
jgi:hypothetical protein